MAFANGISVRTQLNQRLSAFIRGFRFFVNQPDYSWAGQNSSPFPR
jgi:hypothetical protein